MVQRQLKCPTGSIFHTSTSAVVNFADATTAVLRSSLVTECAGNADSSVAGCNGKNVQLNCS